MKAPNQIFFRSHSASGREYSVLYLLPRQRSDLKGEGMLKMEAERECIRRWRDLPRSERTTNEQAALFATALMDDIEFTTSGDRYSFIRGWLQRDLLLRGRL